MNMSCCRFVLIFYVGIVRVCFEIGLIFTVTGMWIIFSFLTLNEDINLLLMDTTW
jgi:uncharacterized membrane protein